MLFIVFIFQLFYVNVAILIFFFSFYYRPPENIGNKDETTSSKTETSFSSSLTLVLD